MPLGHIPLALAMGGVAFTDGRRQRGRVAAVYARYSTKFQDSTDDQVRECRLWAEKNGLEVSDDLVFVDEGKSGRLRRRPGRSALQAALEANRFDTLIVFATSRMDRNDYRIKQFVKEEIVERGKRAVFIMSSVDTDETNWELNLCVRGIVDAQQAKANTAHIQAAQAGLFLKGRVHGTITYGYQGVEVPNTRTRTGKPGRRYAVDPTTSLWVKQAFSWYVQDRLSRSAIVNRLNEQRVPLPPRCATGRWTDLAVKGLLANPRYRGLWRYGATEAVLLSGKDYIRQKPRANASQEAQIEELRIVDDATWHRAQELTGSNPHAAGRKPVDGERKSRPKLLNGLLYCGYHNRPLVVGGSNSTSCLCPVCKQDGQAQLYTLLDRRLALKGICDQIASMLRQDDDLVEQIVAACRRYAEARQQPDPAAAKGLLSDHRRLTQQIGVVFNAFAETDEDRRENQAKVAELRHRRAAVNVQLAELGAAQARPVQVPSDDAVRVMLDNLAQILAGAAEANDAEASGRVRGIIEVITGGKILIFQAGPRERQRGWHRATFKAQVIKVAAAECGVNGHPDEGIDVAVDLREQPIQERIADSVKALFDSGLKYTEIAKQVGFNRNLVTAALAYWHESRGLPAPDGRTCPGRMKSPPRLAERIADQVMDLVGQDVPLQDIARELSTSRNRVTGAIKIWHQRQGLPVPDGRAIRKLRNQRRRGEA